MNYAVAIAMYGWVPAVLALFARLPPRRAVLGGFLLGWMFLPIAAYPIAGLPDYTKMLATCGGVLLAIALFDFRRLISFRLRLTDIPMLLFCLCPFASSIANGLGLHDGASAVFERTIAWGVPYAVGRLYFGGLSQLRELAAGICGGGIVYVPLCLFELVRGPQLHRLVYGYSQPLLDQKTHLDILRPAVFMESGLMVAMWMAAATVLGTWLWKSRALPPRFRPWLAWLLPVLAITTVALRSVNGWIVMAVGAGLLALHSRWRSAAPLIGVMVLIAAYLLVRATGLWLGEGARSTVNWLINAEKEQSIGYRLENENSIMVNVRERPVFGWGRQPALLYDKMGRPLVWDSLWIIVFGQSGTVGLIGLFATLLLPAGLFILRFPASRWPHPDIAPATALAVVLVLYATDNLANAMINPIFMLAAGGLAELRANAPADPTKTLPGAQ